MLDIVLQLKAKYFRNADFCSNTNCPVAMAIKSQLSTTEVQVLTYAAYVDEVPYKISYWAKDFYEDLAKAEVATFDDSVVRELTLKQVKDEREFDIIGS